MHNDHLQAPSIMTSQVHRAVLLNEMQRPAWRLPYMFLRRHWFVLSFMIESISEMRTIENNRFEHMAQNGMRSRGFQRMASNTVGQQKGFTHMIDDIVRHDGFNARSETMVLNTWPKTSSVSNTCLATLSESGVFNTWLETISLKCICKWAHTWSEILASS